MASHLDELAGSSEDDERPRRPSSGDFCPSSPSGPSAARSTDDQRALYRRPPVRQGARPGDGRQAGRAAGAQVAAVPLSRARPGRSTTTTSPSRLSFGLWDSLPDQTAAATPRRGRQADDPRASRRAGRADGRRPADPGQAPRVPAPLAEGRSGGRARQGPRSCSRSSTRRSPPTCGRRSTCSSTTWSGARIPTSAGSCWTDDLYLNGRLAKFYGVDLPADAAVPEGRRWTRASAPGVLTHPYLMAGFAYTDDQLADPPRRVPRPERARPASRGRRPRRSPRWPPDLHPDLTTRERVDAADQPRSRARSATA